MGLYNRTYESLEKLGIILSDINNENRNLANANNVVYQEFVYEGTNKNEFKKIIELARSRRTELQNLSLKSEIFCY